MSAETRVYLDTSALAKWYLNEDGSDAFVAWLQGLDVAVVSSLTRTEMRSLLARRRRMGELDQALESLVYATFLDDIAAGFLSLCTTDDPRFDEAAGLIARYPEHPLRTLDALHLAVARHEQVDTIATADTVMADTAQAMGLAVVRF
jgi:uncharacterized protein